MKKLTHNETDKLAEAVALEIDKALSLNADNPQEFVKDLSIVREFIAKQILALKADKYTEKPY